jgi:hypothetical protein
MFQVLVNLTCANPISRSPQEPSLREVPWRHRNGLPAAAAPFGCQWLQVAKRSVLWYVLGGMDIALQRGATGRFMRPLVLGRATDRGEEVWSETSLSGKPSMVKFSPNCPETKSRRTSRSSQWRYDSI